MLGALLVVSLLAAGVTHSTVSWGDDPKQQADVWRPERASGAPVVVFLHGGVWQMGDRQHVENVGAALAARGAVVVTASYRLAPRHRWPAQIEDAAAVVALAKKQAASWGGDPQRLFVVGHSAGGQLATVLLYDARWLQQHRLTPKDLKGVVAVSGVFDLRAPLDEDQHDGGFARFIAPVFGNDVAVLRAASPLDIATKTGTPLLFLTGPDDDAAMQAQTQEMARRLALLGEQPRVVVVKDRDHFALVGEIGSKGDRVTDEIMRFVQQ